MAQNQVTEWKRKRMVFVVEALSQPLGGQEALLCPASFICQLNQGIETVPLHVKLILKRTSVHLWLTVLQTMQNWREKKTKKHKTQTQYSIIAVAFS